ncbi:MAG TPA: J domain-containing protein [Chloroflexota bacterium]|nr:J domain-containing protein [Chloroflexota bacterium]
MRIPFDPATDYYQLLGVAPGASVDEIQAAYRRLAKAVHPDLNSGSTAAAARMAQVNVAKSVLLDPETRASYDQFRATRRRAIGQVVSTPAPPPSTVRYAPYAASTSQRPRYRVVSQSGGRAARSGFDRQTGLLLVVALPLIAALVLYVFQAFQLSVQPLRAAPPDLSQMPASRPTARGAADAVFAMLHAQPPSRELATRANNMILARANSTPESELLRADGRRLLQSATAGDDAAWNATVDDVCRLAGRC